jgi:hypothetical protein
VPLDATGNNADIKIQNCVSLGSRVVYVVDGNEHDEAVIDLHQRFLAQYVQRCFRPTRRANCVRASNNTHGPFPQLATWEQNGWAFAVFLIRAKQRSDTRIWFGFTPYQFGLPWTNLLRVQCR